MNIMAFVGSAAAIAATAALAALCLLGAAAYATTLVPGWSGATLAFTVVTGVLALMAFMHTSRTVYRRWLKIAEAMNKTVVTVLFGVFYLVVVPVFALLIWPFDLLRLRSRPKATTYWIDRKNTKGDAASLQRLG